MNLDVLQKDKIYKFFKNYKIHEKYKWCKVDKFVDKEKAIEIYNQSRYK